MGKYVSDKTRIGHAQGAHKYVERDKDILSEWWRVANVAKYTYMAIPHEEAREYCVKAVKFLSMICELDFVYKTSNKRWELYTQVERMKKKYPDIDTEQAIILCSGNRYGIDCSALVLSCLYWAGFPFKGTWRTYTGGLRTVLRKSGLFDIYEDTEHLSTDKYAKCGALYWKVNPSGGQGHVVMSMDDYPEEPIPTPEPEKPDQYVEIIKGSVNIRSESNKKGKVLKTAKKGEIYELLGYADNGWYQVSLGDALVGYISNLVPEYVKVMDNSKMEAVSAKADPYVEMVSGSLNVREKQIIGKKIGVAKKGEKYDVLEITSANWYRIQFGDTEGYVSGNTKYTKLMNVE